MNGSNVSLEGHTHSSIDITDFASAVIGAGTSVFASTSHVHEELSGITVSSIEKETADFTTVTASVGNFDMLNVSDAIFSMATVSANSVTVNGTPVSLEGHSHALADVNGLAAALSTYASAGHTHEGLVGLTSNGISKTTAQFDYVSASTATFTNLTVSQADFQVTRLSADAVTVGGSNVSLEGHVHGMS